MTRRRVRVVTPPASEPITLVEAKSHLRVDFPEDDAYITSLITVARDYAEGFQRKSISNQTLELTQNYFTTPIILERGPVRSVTSIKYTLEDGTVKTVDPSTYLLTVDGYIVPKTYWPTDRLQIVDGVKVVYEAGDSTAIPPSTKHAILLTIGHWYETREPIIVGKTVAKVPLSATSLLWLDRRE